MGKKISDEELLNIRSILIKEYKELAKFLRGTPRQKDIKDNRKRNPNCELTLYKINLYFEGLFELNEICGIKNRSNKKRKNTSKKTHKQFVEEVKSVVGDKFDFLTEYQGSEKYIKLRCKKDGYIWEVNANSFLNNGCHCPKCSKRIFSKDTDYFKKEVHELYPNEEYIVLGEYINAKTKILMKHTSCGNEFFMSPDAILSKHSGCPICRHRKGADKLFLSHEEFIKKVKQKFGEDFNNYEVLSEYKGGKEYIKIKHLECGNEYLQQAGDLLQGKGCKYCCGTMKKSHEQFVKEMFDLYGDEYTVLGKYVNSKTKILIKHNKCGKEYSTSPSSILKRHVCNCTRISKGESTIQNFLEFNKIQYEYQYRIEDCSYKSLLAFDFAILKNSKLIYLIEYDGAQHYQEVKAFGGKEALKLTQLRDEIKDDYCKENNITLIRIPYWEFDNINTILKNILAPFYEVKIPNKNILKNKWRKNLNVKFIELFDKLPNGIYTKTWIRDVLNIEGDGKLSQILNNDMVKKYIENNKIIINTRLFTITNNDTEYNKYFKLISESINNNELMVIRFLKILHNLPCGEYIKKDIREIYKIKSKKWIPTNYLQNPFIQQYLTDNNIIINNKTIFKGGI